MSTNNVENNQNKTKTEETNCEESEQIVETQPKIGETQQKPKLSSTQELALLGLRPNSAHSDSCLCLCCMFFMNICSVPGGAPPVSTKDKIRRKARGLHNWDNDSNDGENDSDGDDNDWVVELANHITGGDNSGHSLGGHGHDGDGGHDGGGDGGGGDGGGGGGGDGGGGE